MRLGLSDLVAPVAVVFVAFGIVFGVASRPALAGASADHPGIPDRPGLRHHIPQSQPLSPIDLVRAQIRARSNRPARRARSHPRRSHRCAGWLDVHVAATQRKIAGSVRPTASFRDVSRQGLPLSRFPIDAGRASATDRGYRLPSGRSQLAARRLIAGITCRALLELARSRRRECAAGVGLPFRQLFGACFSWRGARRC